MKKDNEKNYLKTEQYTKLAEELSQMMTDIHLIQHGLEVMPPLDQVEKGNLRFHYYQAHQYTNTLFSKMQDMNEKLDAIASILYSVDDLKDLKGFVPDEHIIKDAPTESMDDIPAKK